MKPEVRILSLTALLFAIPWLAATLVANINIAPIAPSSGQQQPLPTPAGGNGIIIGSSLLQGPSLSELIALGAALSLIGGAVIWRSWKHRRKKDDFWYVERQKGSPLISIMMLGLAALVFYGIFMLVKNSPVVFSGSSQIAGFPDILPYLAMAAIIASSVTGAALFLSLRGGRTTRSSGGQPTGTVDGTQISKVLDEAARALGQGSDYRATILNCYRAIYQILSRDEKVDSSKLTAREFEALVASNVRVDRRYLHEATLLFEKARYSVDPVYGEDANHAQMCLRKLSEDVRPALGQPSVGAV